MSLYKTLPYPLLQYLNHESMLALRQTSKH